MTHLLSAILDLAQAPRTVTFDMQASSSAVISVTYPPDTEFDSHQHDDAFLCLVVAGGYEEWSGAKRFSVQAGQELVYDAARLHLESLALELHWSVPPKALEPTWLRRVRTRMREGYARPITLAELATDAGRHPSHLAREFRRHHGMTAGEYLSRIRVAAAARRLADTDIPLSQVALDVGFADQSHLGRYVRRYLGTTPKAVRARLRRR